MTGSSLVEGWSAASLRASVLSAAVLRYQDLKAGAVVEGEVAAVESFGLLVKLGEGVRALVPKNHLGDVTVKNPKARFKASFFAAALNQVKWWSQIVLVRVVGISWFQGFRIACCLALVHAFSLLLWLSCFVESLVLLLN